MCSYVGSHGGSISITSRVACFRELLNDASRCGGSSPNYAGYPNIRVGTWTVRRTAVFLVARPASAMADERICICSGDKPSNVSAAPTVLYVNGSGIRQAGNCGPYEIRS